MPYPGGLFSLGGLQVFKSTGVMAGGPATEKKSDLKCADDSCLA